MSRGVVVRMVRAGATPLAPGRAARARRVGPASSLAVLVLSLVGCPEAPSVPADDAGMDSGATDARPVGDAGDATTTDAGTDAPTACADPDVDGDGADSMACGGLDCDDADPLRAPGLPEVCDGADRDEDCDAMTFGQVDLDLDGHFASTCCNVATDGARTCGLDCDDARADVAPGAADFCDARDNDCDTAIDEAPLDVFYPDGDGDGFGDPAGTPVAACTRPVGHVPDNTDCDDARAASNPGAPETCNTMDDDCDAMVDEGDAAPLTFYRDIDGDGYGGTSTITSCTLPAGYVTLPGDCNDTQPSAHPGAIEVCDRIDNNCVGGIDEGSAAPTTWHRDADNDLYGSITVTMVACMAPPGYVANGTDCNDGAGTVHPNAVEACNMVDDNCVAGADEGGVCACTLGAMRSCGVGVCSADMQTCVTIGPGVVGWDTCTATPQPETCDTRDNDCDGMTDELPEAIASCADLPNSTPRCAAGGGCTFTCDAGYANCDAMTTNGCEVRLALGIVSSDDRVDDCGACGTDCIITSNTSVSGARCTGATGTCSMTCTGTRQNCNAVYADGCESDRATDLNNCGGCGTRCTAAPANGTAACITSACSFTCNPGYYRSGASCVPVLPPRLVAPLSTSIVTSNCPTAVFVLAAATTGADIQVCRDRLCMMIDRSLTSQTTGAGLCGTTTLSAGIYYWRARGRIGSNVGLTWSPTWQFRASTHLGVTVPSARGTTLGTELDLRGDGFPDVAIGENEADRVRLFFGAAAGLPASASATASSPDAGGPGRFGIAATSAGDVNGDGYGDLLVGASGPNGTSGDTPSAGSNVNLAYVFHGGSGAPGAVSARLTAGTGATATSGFGYGITSPGDVNLDGYGDVVVGAYWDQRAYVYLGSATGLATTPAATLSPPDSVAGGLFGVSMVGADLNADGYGDVAIGRPLVTPRVFVYCGSATGVGTTPCATFTGASGTNFGISVAAGDLNRDGGPDLVVSGNLGTGTVQAFFGRAGSFDTTADGTWTDVTSGTGFGASVAALSFLGADYDADIVVGAPGARTVYVFRGGSVLTSGTIAQAGASMTSTTALFGRYVARAGAIRGGGGQYADLVVSGCSAGMPAMCSNTAWFWNGAFEAPTSTPDYTRTGTSGFGIACNR